MDIITKLTAFATKLDTQGHMALASDVDGATAVFVKVAKQLGGQGYWVQNGRCWQGCYRSKRSSRPKTTAQEIWFECQEEYEKAIAGDGSDWAKYAGTDGALIKTAEADQFSDIVKALIESGEDIGTAVFTTIQTKVAENQFDAIEAAQTLTNVSEKLAGSDAELSAEAASLAGDLIKEAWGLGGLSNIVAPLTNKMRGLGPNSKNVNLTNISTLLNQLNTTLQGFVKQKQAFEQAVKNSPGIPPALRQTLFKGLRPLSQQSMQQMQKTLADYQKMGQKPDFTQGLPKMTPEGQIPAAKPAAPGAPTAPNQNAKLDHSKTPPTDPAANGTQHLKPQTNLDEDGLPKLKEETPEQQHDEKEVMNLVRSLTPEVWNGVSQEARRLIEQAKVMQSTGINARASLRNLFRLMKTATAVAEPMSRKRPVRKTVQQQPPVAPVQQPVQQTAVEQPAVAAPQAGAVQVNPAEEAAAPPVIQPPVAEKKPRNRGGRKREQAEHAVQDAGAAAGVVEPKPVADAANVGAAEPTVQQPEPQVAPQPPQAPQPTQEPQQPQAGPYTSEAFTSDFDGLSPDVKQFVLKHLAPLVQKAKADYVGSQPSQSQTLAESKKRLFKLA